MGSRLKLPRGGFRQFQVNVGCLALSSRTGTDREGQQRVGYNPFAKPSPTDRYLRTWDGRSRREPDIADRGGGRRIWAESPPTPFALGKTGVRPKAAIPWRGEIGFDTRRGPRALSQRPTAIAQMLFARDSLHAA